MKDLEKLKNLLTLNFEKQDLLELILWAHEKQLKTLTLELKQVQANKRYDENKDLGIPLCSLCKSMISIAEIKNFNPMEEYTCKQCYTDLTNRSCKKSSS
jgi:hypothetical protein